MLRVALMERIGYKNSRSHNKWLFYIIVKIFQILCYNKIKKEYYVFDKKPKISHRVFLENVKANIPIKVKTLLETNYDNVEG